MTNKTSYLQGRSTIAVEPDLQDNTLKVRVRCTRDLRRFFQASEFFIRYEDDITAGGGLLGVTAVALLLPLAWLTGSDIRVARLDRTFGQAAEALQREFSAIYPRMPFGTKLIVEEWVDTPPNPEGTAILYSGGMDATYSFFANREKRPRLIQVFGTEYPLSSRNYLEKQKKLSSEFAERNGVPISYLQTELGTLFDNRCVMHRLVPVRERVQGDLWKAMGYALGFLGMTAPLSAGRFNDLIIAAWANEEHANRMRENPDSSSPRVDEKIRWSNLSVHHHGCLHRHEKARAMKDWLPGNPLRVCWTIDGLETRTSINCHRCEKCARSIIALAVGGVDPESCGFSITPDTVKFMKELLINKRIPPSHLAFWWGPMQREIPEELEDGMFGLREFLLWFRSFDLGNGLDPVPYKFYLDYIYHRFPYPVSKAIRSIVYGIVREPRH